MAYLHGEERGAYVKQTFRHVARRYNRMNHLMTFGMDIVLRKEVVRIANPQSGERLLDAGTGTGDMAREAHRVCPDAHICAMDFSLEMICAGKDWAMIDRSQADVLALPFADEVFDIAMSGYLVRNVIDLDKALAEQYRVLKPGGRILVLDTTRPRKNMFTPFIKLYFRTIIPLLGKLLTGNREAYTYLTQSSERFISAETLADLLARCGFSGVKFRVRMIGTMAIHEAVKP